MRYIPANQEFNSVLKCYKLGPLLSDAKRMGGASSNVNFALDTPQGRYFCRVRSGYSEQDALLHRVLIHLTDKGFATPPLLRTANGETYAKYNNRIYELFPFAQGEEFDKGNHEQFAAMGRAIAQFHRCMEDFECSIPFERFAGRGFWNNYPHLQRMEHFMGYTARDVSNREWPAELKERIIKALKQTRQAMEEVMSVWELIEPALPRAFVHGDYHFANVRFRGNEVAYVCDFDFVMPAERIFDIITAFAWWMEGDWIESPPDASYLKPFCEFLASYNEQSAQILTSDEIRALIPDMQRLLLLYGSKAAMHYDNFEGMLKWLTSHLKHAEWLGRYQMEFEQGLSLQNKP
jgi:Ser/Thr protein kinase RdoA (MazF antagonist)